MHYITGLHKKKAQFCPKHDKFINYFCFAEHCRLPLYICPPICYTGNDFGKRGIVMIQLLLIVIYISFISLGLPDGLLGAGWPSMYPQMDVPVSYSGIVFFIICMGTVISSLQSDRLTRSFGTGRVTAMSVGLTAAALLGFAASRHFWQLCLWAIPYGLGAGSVDASLNNYVALNYKSRHMSWLHCMWGIGASVGPYIMSAVLTGDSPWHRSYLLVGIVQLVLTVGLFCSLPLWKKPTAAADSTGSAMPLRQVLAIPGAKAIMLAFFCYCALEQTVCLWSASFLNLHLGLDPETSAGWASMFYLGITVGRLISGFVTMKLSDKQMIRFGMGILAVGVAMLLLPLGSAVALAGLLLIGLGCAPIYPCIIHSTPEHFGPENSQAMVGVQMASAYLGNCMMPPLFGLIANHIGISLLPVYLLAILIVMALMYEKTCRSTHK